MRNCYIFTYLKCKIALLLVKIPNTFFQWEKTHKETATILEHLISEHLQNMLIFFHKIKLVNNFL